MKQIVLILGIVAALAGMGWSISSCASRAGGGGGRPENPDYDLRCRACGFEFRLTPRQLNAAYDAGEVRNGPDGLPVFKCPQCGKVEAGHVMRGQE